MSSRSTWHKFVDAGRNGITIVDTPASLNIIERFLLAARQYPGKVAFCWFDACWNRLTYQDFARQVRAGAALLVKRGLKRGDRVAIVSENRHEWCSAYLSVVMACGIAVPIDAQLGPGEIENLLRDSGSRYVFHSRKTLQGVAGSAATSEEDRVRPILIDLDSTEYRKVTEAEPNGIFQHGGPNDVASIIYTSGTTGIPKGVELTDRNFCSDAEALIAAGVVSHDDNVLSILPLHHTYAFMCTFLVPLFLGASVTYPASLKGPDIMAAAQECGVSVIIGVPQLLGMIRNGIADRIGSLRPPLPFTLFLLQRISGKLREAFGINIGRVIFRSAHAALGPRFRFFASGGARLDPAIMRDLEAFGFTVLEGYGLTETSPVVTFNPVTRRKPGSAGRPLQSVAIRILNPSPTGEGEIAISGPMVMNGYYRNTEATAGVFEDGWFKTGDIGRIDKDGYLFITGRSKEVIVLSSGKNIYPEDVEKVYMAIPLIKEICVLGTEERGGESLHAMIVPDLDYARRNGVGNIQEELKWRVNEISGRIPSFMRITGFSIRSEPLPRTPLGKLRRFLIKSDLAGKPSWRREAAETDSISEDETAAAIVTALRHFVREGGSIGANDNLELDIGLDSLSKIELVVLLEKSFSLKLSEDFLAGVQTVGELVEKVKTMAKGGSQGETAEKAGWKEILAREPSENGLRTMSFENSGSIMVSAFFGHSLLKLLFKVFFRLGARGTSNLPSQGNFILAPNHTSYLDGFAVILSMPFSRFRNIYSLGQSDYFTGFVKRQFARIAHVIPIDSSAYLNKALQTSAHLLKRGGSLVVFPEGGRSYDGNLMEFKKGVGILAVELGVAVIPVHISGAFDALPRSAMLPRLKKITVVFGEPLLSRGLDFSKRPKGVDEYQYFADELRERVRALGENEKVE
jgi:long-chain acyl-CoA synthetase